MSSSSSVFSNINSYVVSIFATQTYVNPAQYDGLEFKYKFFVFRPALFQRELFLFSGLILYILFSLWGRAKNSKITKTWLDAHRPTYEQQFSNPSVKGVTKDGHSDAFSFATGRRNIASLHTIFALRPRHDFLQWAFQIGKTFVDLHYRPTDDLQLDFTLAPGAVPFEFVWAVVAKDELLSIKDSRWDLTFTKTTENSAIPQSLSIMSEFADVTESLLKLNGASTLANILSDPTILPYFRSLSITDQPRYRPSKPIPAEQREKHVILTLSAPPPSAADTTVPLVAALFTFIDSLGKLSLRPETKTKLKKARDDLDRDLKEETMREKKEEITQALDDKKAEKRRAEEERVSKLSAAEQAKILEKERKRVMRKAQGKQMVRK